MDSLGTNNAAMLSSTKMGMAVHYSLPEANSTRGLRTCYHNTDQTLLL